MTPDNDPQESIVVVGCRAMVIKQKPDVASNPPDCPLDPLEKPYHDSGDVINANISPFAPESTPTLPAETANAHKGSDKVSDGREGSSSTQKRF